MKSIVLFLLLLGGSVVGRSLAAQQAPQEAVPAFQVGDAIRITVWGHADLSGEFEVGGDGTILHPLYQTLVVAGLTVEQATEAVRGVLTRFVTEPEFIVEPLIRVAVGGAVGSPSIYTFSTHTTVAQAVTQAGPAPAANLESVRLLRNGQTYAVDLTRPYREIAYVQLRSGDQVIVDPKRGIWRQYIRPAIGTAGSLASVAWLVLRISRVL